MSHPNTKKGLNLDFLEERFLVTLQSEPVLASAVFRRKTILFDLEIMGSDSKPVTIQ